MPVEEEEASSTITGASMIGSAKEPANAVEAAADRAAASTSFFISLSPEKACHTIVRSRTQDLPRETF